MLRTICTVLPEWDCSYVRTTSMEEDKHMKIQIHPAQQEGDYTTLLLTLLAQSVIPALAEELLPETPGDDARSA